MDVVLGILGPVRALRGDTVVRVGPRERAVLARLVLDANRVVSVDRLIDAVWQGSPPASARGQIAICVSRLRKAVGPVIDTASPGYVVRAESDWGRFNALVARARSADRAAAVGLLREALSLWRGTPFEDVPGLRAEAVRLQSARLDAAEACAELELELGLHDRVGKDLAALVAEHPLRERARAQLMVAHYRAGRRAEALRVYQDARRVLVEQIGLEPGPQLRGLHEQILRDTLPTPVVGEAPSQLPRQPLPFAGRAHDLAALDDALADGPDAPGAAVLCGPGEVGKTALALRWAHQRMDRFPDGQLYADLVGENGRPVPSSVVLDRFLRALGVRSIPDDPGEKVAAYRSSVARRRLLVVLDGATDTAHLAPLLPGGPHTRVIVTSRDPLDEFAARSGARQHFLEPLAFEESRSLLSMLLGPEWVAAQPQEAAHIARQAGGFPLPVRRAAARLRRQGCLRPRDLISA